MHSSYGWIVDGIIFLVILVNFGFILYDITRALKNMAIKWYHKTIGATINT